MLFLRDGFHLKISVLMIYGPALLLLFVASVLFYSLEKNVILALIIRELVFRTVAWHFFLNVINRTQYFRFQKH
ncbi:hypothetical protein MXB_2710, partial [Myxobolus squamalis]